MLREEGRAQLVSHSEERLVVHSPASGFFLKGLGTEDFGPHGRIGFGGFLRGLGEAGPLGEEVGGCFAELKLCLCPKDLLPGFCGMGRQSLLDEPSFVLCELCEEQGGGIGEDGGPQVSASPVVLGDICPRECAAHFAEELFEGVGPLHGGKGEPTGCRAVVEHQGQSGVGLG